MGKTVGPRATHSDQPPQKKQCTEQDTHSDENDDPDYFDLYSSIDIHRDMLEDKVRTEGYLTAIRHNVNTIRDRVVLDVGMGTGILSYFSSREGAKKVYGVEACSTMVEQIKKIISHNGMGEKVSVIHGLMEKVQVPEKVDVIVSEWMGYMLLYESMLDSVIYARDHYLKPGGTMLPSRCEIFIAPFSDLDEEEEEEKDIDFWDDVYGFDFSPMKPFVRECETKEPEICEMPAHWLIGHKAQSIKQIDCLTVTLEDLTVRKDFLFNSMITGKLHGFAVWFDCEFDTDENFPVFTLSTSPHLDQTHWCQTLLKFTTPVPVSQDQEITGSISIQKATTEKRCLAISLTLSSPVSITKRFIFE